MEKQISDLDHIKIYQNRQVILNFYEEELLWKRDGFYFNSLEFKNGCLVFIKNNEVCYTLSLETLPIRNSCSDFEHYFIFRNERDRVEMYFS